jgi:AraC-like DNA-binding protein
MKPKLVDIDLRGKRTIQIKKINQFCLDSFFHFHHLCELVWMEESYGKRIIGDNVDSFSEGDLILMAPHLPHIWKNDPVFLLKKKGLRCKATVIYFPTDFLQHLSDDPAVTRPTQELISNASRGLSFHGQTVNKVAHILSGIAEEDGFKKIVEFLKIMDILSHSKEYRQLASISYKNVTDEKDTARINAAYQFLMQNFHRDVTLEELSGVCNMAPTAFCRFFKSKTQKSFIQVLNELRIGHACSLLQKSDYSIIDACYESGYNNYVNFNKCFKLITGQTPSGYRKSFQEL